MSDCIKDWRDSSENERDGAFTGTKVKNVYIPKTVTYISGTAFNICPTLESIAVDKDNLMYYSKDGVLYKCGDAKVGGCLSYISICSKIGRTFSIAEYDFPDDYSEIVSYQCSYNEYMADPGISEEKKAEARERCANDWWTEKQKAYPMVFNTDGTIKRYLRDERAKVEERCSVGREYFIHGALYEDVLMKYPEGKKDKSFTTPNYYIDVYNNYQFYNCQYLKNLTISCGYFGGDSHYRSSVAGCTSLETLTIGTIGFGCSDKHYLAQENGAYPNYAEDSLQLPNLKKVIFTQPSEYTNGIWDFSGCPALEEIVIPANDPYFKSLNGAVLSKDGKILYTVPSNVGSTYTVPDGVESVMPQAFKTLKDGTTVTFPKSIKGVGVDLDRSKYKMYKDENGKKVYVTDEFGNYVVEEYYYSGRLFVGSSGNSYTFKVPRELEEMFKNVPDTSESLGGSKVTINYI